MSGWSCLAGAEAGHDEPEQDWAHAWTVAMDALAGVSVAAAAATAEAQLRQDSASALAEPPG